MLKRRSSIHLIFYMVHLIIIKKKFKKKLYLNSRLDFLVIFNIGLYFDTKRSRNNI